MGQNLIQLLIFTRGFLVAIYFSYFSVILMGLKVVRSLSWLCAHAPRARLACGACSAPGDLSLSASAWDNSLPPVSYGQHYTNSRPRICWHSWHVCLWLFDPQPNFGCMTFGMDIPTACCLVCNAVNYWNVCIQDKYSRKMSFFIDLGRVNELVYIVRKFGHICDKVHIVQLNN